MRNITLQLAFFFPTVQSIMNIFSSYYLETLDKTVKSSPKFCRIFNKVNRNISFVSWLLSFRFHPRRFKALGSKTYLGWRKYVKELIIVLFLCKTKVMMAIYGPFLSFFKKEILFVFRFWDMCKGERAARDTVHRFSLRGFSATANTAEFYLRVRKWHVCLCRQISSTLWLFHVGWPGPLPHQPGVQSPSENTSQ